METAESRAAAFNYLRVDQDYETGAGVLRRAHIRVVGVDDTYYFCQVLAAQRPVVRAAGGDSAPQA